MKKIEQQAQQALHLLKQAVVDLIDLHPEGLRNSEVTKILGLQSDQRGRNKDYLTWSILGLLMKEDRIVRNGTRYLTNRGTS